MAARIGSNSGPSGAKASGGEKLGGETVRRKVGDLAEEFPEVEGGLLERETGIEPATLSLGM
jgi:hypothetical protein